MFRTTPHACRFAALLVAAAGAPALAQCPAAWLLASAGPPNVPTDPPIRQNHALAYDEARGRIVLFGGFLGGFGFYGDTWGWSGEGWTQLANTGPDPRANIAMAYDSVRARVVLFGGAAAAGAFFGDTWEWNGTTWTLMSPVASPPGRFNHAMAFDRARNVTVMTGGFSTLRYSDTWEYDGTTWTLRAGTTYGGRNGHGMAYDESRNKMVVYGGFNGARLNDTREYDAVTGNWSQVAITGPTTPLTGGRQYVGLSYDPDQHVIVLFGGQAGPASGDRLNDTWAYNGVAWTQIGAGTPPPDPVPPGQPYRRDQHAIAYDRTNHRMVLFGGYQGAGFGGDVADTWTTGCTASPCYANCDGSTVQPVLTVADFGCFLNAFAAGQSYANCDGSTNNPALTVADFGCFLNAFAAGCP